MVPPPVSSSISVLHALSHPVLTVRGMRVPSPFHLQLRIITKLTFNEQGRVTAHRDFWDVRDLAGLVPGVRAVQWVATRLAAHGLAATGWLFNQRQRREDEGSPPGVSNEGSLNALGLLGLRPKRTQAPDTDPDTMANP